MKNQNLILVTVLFFSVFITPSKVFSQTDEENISQINLNNFQVNDSIILMKPLGDKFTFIYKKNDIKKKVKKKSKLFRKLGNVLNSVGATTRNIGVLKSGIRVLQASNLIGNAIDVSTIFEQNIEDISVILEDIYIVKNENYNTLIGEFKVKNISYLVDLNNAFSANEISKK